MDTQIQTVGTDAEDDGAPANYQTFEEIYIKEEPLEESSQNCEFYENVLLSVKKEECISVSDNDEQSDKEYEKTNDTNSKRFYCAICNKSFTRKYRLATHLKIHTGIKEYECGVCKKLFALSDYLKRHMEVHTAPQVVKDISYSTNKISFPDICSPTKSEIKQFKCTICNKQFAYECYLTRHMKVHNYKCTKCDRQFAHRNRYLLHMKVHIGTKDYHCSVCGKSFLDKSYLKKHMKIHRRETILP